MPSYELSEERHFMFESHVENLASLMVKMGGAKNSRAVLASLSAALDDRLC